MPNITTNHAITYTNERNLVFLLINVLTFGSLHKFSV